MVRRIALIVGMAVAVAACEVIELVPGESAQITCAPGESVTNEMVGESEGAMVRCDGADTALVVCTNEPYKGLATRSITGQVANVECDARPPVFGHPVYTQAEIDSWSTTDTDYTALAATGFGNVNRSVLSYGAQISGSNLNSFNADSGHVKVQAALWAADGTSARRNKVDAVLDDLGSVTSLAEATAGQPNRKLAAGWACTNLAQAAAIIGYQTDPGNSAFRDFLDDVCWPLLDHPKNPNWHASFADSKLAVAAYLEDTTRWNEAIDYFYTRLPQSVYHSAYDGTTVEPLRDSNGNIQQQFTLDHWGAENGRAQIASDFTFLQTAAPVFDGVNAERRRDLGHVNMSIAAWMHAARTIRAQQVQITNEAYDRLHAMVTVHSARMRAYFDANPDTVPAPDTGGAIDVNDYAYGWWPTRAYFLSDTPTDVVALTASPYPQPNAGPAGNNHTIAEPFADG